MEVHTINIPLDAQNSTNNDATLIRCYVRMNETTYGFAEDVVNTLQPGFYRPMWDYYNNIGKLEKRNVISPNLYRLPDSNLEDIVQDIEHFWQSEDKYKKFGNVYKRSFLLHSVPGNGKTSLINILAFDLINKYQGIIFAINSSEDLRAYPKCLERIRNVEPTRKIITIIEDFDGLMRNESDETLLLQLLDGNNQFDNIVTIATTNYIDKIKPSFLDRPSRFNRLIDYKKPNATVREFYFTKKLEDSGLDISVETIKEQIQKMTKVSEGYTFDYCKELAELIYISEISVDEAAKIIQERLNYKGKYKETETISNEDQSTKIGF